MRFPPALLVLTLLLLLCAAAVSPSAAFADPPDEEPADTLPVETTEETTPVARYVPPPRPRAYEPDQASLTTLAGLSREIQAFIEGSEGVVGVALVRGSDDLLLVNGETPLPLHSAAKLVLMLAYLEKLQAEGREPDELEADLLDAMITYSDNGATDYLWYAFGDAEAMQAYVERQGLSDAQVVFWDWGESMDSARDLGHLLTRLHAQHLLDPWATEYAVDLLSRVHEGQRWGVSAGLDRSEERRDTVLLKNGWYPVGTGWRMNSAGLVLPGDGSSPYALVVLAEAQPTYDYGLETIETIAAMVNGYMRSGALGLAALR